MHMNIAACCPRRASFLTERMSAPLSADAPRPAEAQPPRSLSYFYDEAITVYSSVEANLLKPHILK